MSKFKIAVHQIGKYRYKLVFDDSYILGIFADFMTSRVQDMEIVGGKRENVIYKVPCYIESSFDNEDYSGNQLSIEIKRGMLEWVIWWCAKGTSIDVDIDCESLCKSPVELLRFDPDGTRHIKLNDKWRGIFNSHPRGEFYSNAQIEGFENLMLSPNSSVELGTGLGKTELILAVIEHWREYIGWGEGTGNILILVPNNAIRDEILIRAESYGVGELISTNVWDDPTARVNIVNPVGYFNSKQCQSPDSVRWMENVRYVITDEAHKLSSDSYHRLFEESCPNIDVSYAVSGTLDKHFGNHLHPNKTSPTSMHPDNVAVVGFSGCTRMNRKVEIDTHLYTVECEVTRRLNYDALEAKEKILLQMDMELNWLEKFNLLMDSPKLPRIVKFVYDHASKQKNNPRLKLYMPFYGKVVSVKLAEAINSQFLLDVCYWESGLVLLNGLEVGSSLADVKRLAKENAFQILLSSSVGFEGADLENIQAVLTMVGSNQARSLQPIGRAARGERLDIYLLHDRFNKMICSQTNKRKSTIVKYYNIKTLEVLRCY